MKKQIKQSKPRKNPSVWAKIVALSKVPQPYTGVIRHVGAAY